MQVSKQVSKQVRADTDAVFSSRWWQSSLNIYKIATPDRQPLAAVMFIIINNIIIITIIIIAIIIITLIIINIRI